MRRSSHHWYNKFRAILEEIGLSVTLNDPCLFSGTVLCDGTPPTSRGGTERAKVYVGMYVDDFVFYSSDADKEQHFHDALPSRITVDFMDVADYFLGTAFT